MSRGKQLEVEKRNHHISLQLEGNKLKVEIESHDDAVYLGEFNAENMDSNVLKVFKDATALFNYVSNPNPKP